MSHHFRASLFCIRDNKAAITLAWKSGFVGADFLYLGNDLQCTLKASKCFDDSAKNMTRSHILTGWKRKLEFFVPSISHHCIGRIWTIHWCTVEAWSVRCTSIYRACWPARSRFTERARCLLCNLWPRDWWPMHLSRCTAAQIKIVLVLPYL